MWGSRGSTLNVSSKVDLICERRKPDVTCELKMANIFECLGIGCRTIWAPWLYWLVKAQRSSNLGYFLWRPNTGLSCRPYSWEEWAKKCFYGCVGWMALYHEHVNQLFGSFTSPLLQENHRKRRARLLAKANLTDRFSISERSPGFKQELLNASKILCI